MHALEYSIYRTVPLSLALGVLEHTLPGAHHLLALCLKGLTLQVLPLLPMSSSPPKK